MFISCYSGLLSVTCCLSVQLTTLNLQLCLCMVVQIRLSDPSQYQSIVDAEWNIIYDKLDKCVQSGAKIVLSRLAIGDLATQYFADRDIFCAGRVSRSSCCCCRGQNWGTVASIANTACGQLQRTGYCPDQAALQRRARQWKARVSAKASAFCRYKRVTCTESPLQLAPKPKRP